MGNFHKILINKIFTDYKNKYYDNFDFEIRSGTPSEKFAIGRVAIEKAINQNFNFLLLPSIAGSYFIEHIDDFEYLYELLDDEKSRASYIELLAYKILGFTKVKLSLNNREFWQMRNSTSLYETGMRLEMPNFQKGYLTRYDLRELGFDLDLYFISNGIVAAFMLEQYAYQDTIAVQTDDVVIDCGGCWGDTALYFAAKGAKEVYVFEFVESNLEIMKTNIGLNEKYADTIKIVQNPVWNESGVPLSYIDNGPGSRVGEYDEYEHKIETLSIDDLVKLKNIARVDFIKMDIEGAEIPALKGAAETIKKFKPKLAISAYHKADDLVAIPKLIRSIRDDYHFYIDYYTIIADEIVLYAI